MSPSFSLARDKNLMIYVLYEKKGYAIYKADPNEFSKKIVPAGMIDLSAANLVTEPRMYNPSSVNANLKRYFLEDESKFTTKPYQSAFRLETIGSAGVGVGFDQNNTAASGGISFLFSDMLKRNQLFTALRVHGRLIDVGGQAVYINQKKRLNWGISLSHIPYLSVGSFIRRDTIEDLPVIDIVQMETRIFQDEVSLFGIYPLSKKLRFEAGISGSHYSFRIDSINYYYSGRTFLGEDKTQLDSPDPFQLYNAYIAYVGDNTHFGLTSPLRGYRYGIQLGRTHRISLMGFLIIEPYYAIPFQLKDNKIGHLGINILSGGW